MLSSRRPFPSHPGSNGSDRHEYPRNLAAHICQDCNLPNRGSAEFQWAQLLDQGNPPRVPSPKSIQGGVSGGVSPCVQSTSHLRGVDQDVRVTRGRRRTPSPPPPPIHIVNCHHDGRAGGSVPARSTSRTSNSPKSCIRFRWRTPCWKRRRLPKRRIGFASTDRLARQG